MFEKRKKVQNSHVTDLEREEVRDTQKDQWHLEKASLQSCLSTDSCREPDLPMAAVL